MHISFAISAFAIAGLVNAGQSPLGFQVGSDYCTRGENEVLISLSRLFRGINDDLDTCGPDRLGKQSTLSPWTLSPKCMPQQNSSSEYCVYTNNEFAGGRGISFFTSPSIAERIAALPAFTGKNLYSKVNEFDDPPWEIKMIPGRGKGLFATRTLHRGDKIVTSTPVGAFQSDALMADFALDYIYLHTAFIHLPEYTQELFMSTMAGSKGDPIMERINTNAFSGEFEGVPHFLMYPETARMNHDCRPNAMYYYDSGTLIHSTIAAQTIEPGEEITIPYDSILRPREERQKSLKDYWGFSCTCSVCSGSAQDIARSDGRVQEILDLQTELANWSPWSTGTPAMAEMLISLYEEEHLHAAKATGHIFAALAYSGVGDRMMAEWHAELALEAGMVNSGPNDDVTAMKKLLEDPEGHWSWMARRSKGEL